MILCPERFVVDDSPPKIGAWAVKMNGIFDKMFSSSDGSKSEVPIVL